MWRARCGRWRRRQGYIEQERSGGAEPAAAALTRAEECGVEDSALGEVHAAAACGDAQETARRQAQARRRQAQAEEASARRLAWRKHAQATREREEERWERTWAERAEADERWRERRRRGAALRARWAPWVRATTDDAGEVRATAATKEVDTARRRGWRGGVLVQPWPSEAVGGLVADMFSTWSSGLVAPWLQAEPCCCCHGSSPNLAVREPGGGGSAGEAEAAGRRVAGLKARKARHPRATRVTPAQHWRTMAAAARGEGGRVAGGRRLPPLARPRAEEQMSREQMSREQMSREQMSREQTSREQMAEGDGARAWAAAVAEYVESGGQTEHPGVYPGVIKRAPRVLPAGMTEEEARKAVVPPTRGAPARLPWSKKMRYGSRMDGGAGAFLPANRCRVYLARTCTANTPTAHPIRTYQYTLMLRFGSCKHLNQIYV